MVSNTVLKDYLREQSLRLDLTGMQVAALTLTAVLSADKPQPATDLFHYRVPPLGEGGSCSLPGPLADLPYDLAPWFGGASREAACALADLGALLDSCQHQIAADWLGIYAVRGVGASAVLLKLAYRGAPSRATFPLTEAFAEISNNSRVGLTGWGVVIDDVHAWKADGAGYYQCDPAVLSEVCLPVLDAEGRVLGIIDAESHERGFFTAHRQAWLAALACVLTRPLAEMPFVIAE